MSQDLLVGMRVFAAVVDQGSFARAADALDLSRGMTSRHVAAVEARLGARLLHRTTRRISLTEAGREYYQKAVEILSLVDKAESQAGQSSRELHGTIRISAPMTYGKLVLGPVAESFLSLHPGVRLDISLSDRMVDLVEESVDLAIRIARKIDSHLVARPIARASLIACASPRYLQQHGRPGSPPDLARHNCLTYAYSGHRASWRFSKGRREIAVPVSGNFHSNNGELLARAAAAGLGVILEPQFLLREHLDSGALVPILEDWACEEFTVHAVYLSRAYLPQRVRSLVDFLVAYKWSG